MFYDVTGLDVDMNEKYFDLFTKLLKLDPSKLFDNTQLKKIENLVKKNKDELIKFHQPQWPAPPPPPKEATPPPTPQTPPPPPKEATPPASPPRKRPLALPAPPPPPPEKEPPPPQKEPTPTPSPPKTPPQKQKTPPPSPPQKKPTPPKQPPKKPDEYLIINKSITEKLFREFGFNITIENLEVIDQIEEDTGVDYYTEWDEKEEKKIRDYIEQNKEEFERRRAERRAAKKGEQEARIEELPEDQGAGKGKNDGGLLNTEILQIMKKYHPRGFKGVYALDQLHKIPIHKNDKMISFIMNTEPISVPNGHWVGVVLTPNNLEYYDSFGEEPSKKFLKNMKRLAQTWSPDKLLQFKINRIKYQRTNSDNCGYFAMKFIKDRHDGQNFKEATGFEIINKALKGEKEIQKFKSKVREFGAI